MEEKESTIRAVGTLKSGKEWFIVDEKQAREIITKHKLNVDEKMFHMPNLYISLIRYKEQDICLWFTPKDDEDAKRFDIPTKMKIMGKIDSLPFGLSNIWVNRYKMNGIDCGEILLYIYG